MNTPVSIYVGIGIVMLVLLIIQELYVCKKYESEIKQLKHTILVYDQAINQAYLILHNYRNDEDFKEIIGVQPETSWSYPDSVEGDF